MALSVADRSSNKNEQIVHAAEVIGRSKHRALVFGEVYRGKAPKKSVRYLMKKTKLPRTRVLDAGKVLSDNDIVQAIKEAGETAYHKVDFFQRYRDRILRLAWDKQKRDKVPTKRNRNVSPSANVKVALDLTIARRSVQAQLITVDDIDSFNAVRQQPQNLDYVRMPETQFKSGVAAILGEHGEFKDWGGELRDLSSTRVYLKGRRRSAAFAFKGPGKSGRLYPGKMGKHGDQIPRLVRCPADLYIVQYWAEIDDSVLDMLQQLVRLKSFLERRELYYGVIDGQDSARLINAFPTKFKRRNAR